MKLTTKHLALSLILGASVLMFTNRVQAATYHVNLNTAPLVSNPNAPFYLDFQFSSGSATEGNNTISLNNFTFGGGGAASGSANLFGNAAGDISSSVTLTDLQSISELYQGFTGSTTAIGFDVNSTSNMDPGLVPDQFSVAILDNTTGQITTSSPDTLELVEQTIGSNAQFFTGTGAYAGIIAAPEPSRAMLMVFGLGLAVFRRRRAQA